MTDCGLQDNELENEVSRQVEDYLKDDSNMDVTQEVDDDLKDEGENDIRHPDGVKADEVIDDIPRKLEDDIKSYEIQDAIQQQPEDEIKDEQAVTLYHKKLDGEILSNKDYGKDDYVINLINLPTELLVKIMFYLQSVIG